MFILRFLLKKVLFKSFMASCLCVRWEQNQDWRNCLVATNTLLSTFMVHTFWSCHGCIMVYMDCTVYVSESHSTILIQYLLSLLERSLQLQWSSSGCTLQRCIWSESTGLDMESSSWEMAPWLQLIMTSPGAFTHQPEFGSRAVAESALNSASSKMLSGPVGGGGLIWAPAGHSYLREINCEIVTLSFHDRTKQREV